MVQVGFRAQVEDLRLGEVGEGLGEAIGAKLAVVVQLQPLPANLLLKQGVEDDRRSPHILNPAQVG